ncbi:acetyl-CoA carboxylase biotin carboxyl carrier protein [Nonomuraea sp. SBT364]|uniref:acetyl-CoA carboxylase biotin carboxyl carrier protein n=1 Tax=Nonomuraea sp. SBT364 TaxID=1580530 RepID=UPI00069F74C9|nr:biotin/lipoyl-containing protein [Nonomuraea sp. SBT364]
MTDLRATVEATGLILDLVRGSDVQRLVVQGDGVTIEVERSALPAASAARPSEAAPDAAAETTAGEPAEAVTAPLMGVFYQRPAPDQPPFVTVGQHVEAGEQVAIVEAMKMMNPVVAEHAGVVVRINVADGEVVEFEQPLMELGAVG